MQRYLSVFRQIDGWFQADAALLFMAYNQLLARHGVAGHTLEIGVHHGLSAIGVASLRGREKLFYAIDLFDDLQSKNTSHSGAGERAVFERNMQRLFPDTGFLRTIARASADVVPADLGLGFSFCHIDGGHSREETQRDLALCEAVLMPGGIVAIDDYFNPQFPGVSEGVARFMLANRGALRPLAIGYQKMLFQKQPALFDLNCEFVEEFRALPSKRIQFWDQAALLFDTPVCACFNLLASTPERFAPFEQSGNLAAIAPEYDQICGRPGERLLLPVAITNTSAHEFPAGVDVFGLSYHLLSQAGRTLLHDNDRTWIEAPLAPGETQTVALVIEAPTDPGRYRLEIDLVWESVMWLKDAGNRTATVELALT